MTDIDGVLLDRLFQPAADRLSERTSCFGLARLCLAAAVALQFVVLACDLEVEGDMVRRVMAVGITALALAGAQQGQVVIRHAERQARPGLMNVRRITMRWQRNAWLVISAWACTIAVGQVSAANVAVCAASLAWLSCIYFLSCSPSPPPARVARGVFAFAS